MFNGPKEGTSSVPRPSSPQQERARHLGDVVEAQTQYAQRAFDAYTSEGTKLGEMCVGMVRDASKSAEDASRRLR
jgi:hypothetical protein